MDVALAAILPPSFYFLVAYNPMKIYELFHATHGRIVDI
jgi:hypothetical protein